MDEVRRSTAHQGVDAAECRSGRQRVPVVAEVRERERAGRFPSQRKWDAPFRSRTAPDAHCASADAR